MVVMAVPPALRAVDNPVMTVRGWRHDAGRRHNPRRRHDPRRRRNHNSRIRHCRCDDHRPRGHHDGRLNHHGRRANHRRLNPNREAQPAAGERIRAGDPGQQPNHYQLFHSSFSVSETPPRGFTESDDARVARLALILVGETSMRIKPLVGPHTGGLQVLSVTFRGRLSSFRLRVDRRRGPWLRQSKSR
jgi:hypothetical protein